MAYTTKGVRSFIRYDSGNQISFFVHRKSSYIKIIYALIRCFRDRTAVNVLIKSELYVTITINTVTPESLTPPLCNIFSSSGKICINALGAG